MSDAKPTLSRTSPRPWYCWDTLVDEYRRELDAGSTDRSMLKTLKVARSLFVTLGAFAAGVYFVESGADPLTTMIVTFGFVSAYNGLELSDYAAFAQAYREFQNDE